MDNNYNTLQEALLAARDKLDGALLDDGADKWNVNSLIDAAEAAEQDDDTSGYYVIGVDGSIGYTTDDGYNVQWIYRAAPGTDDEKLTSVEIWGGDNLNDWQNYDCPEDCTVDGYAEWCIGEESTYWATINSASDKIRLNGWREINGADYFDADGNRK